MSKDDINSLGSLYGGMLNGLKKDLIKEGKVGPNEIGESELEDGGPEAADGFAEAEVDLAKLTDKQAEDNAYNIDNLSYTSSYMPEEDEEGKHDDKDGKKEKCDYVDCEEDKEDEEDAEEKIDLMNAFDKGTDSEDKDTEEDKLIDKKLFDDDDEEDEESSQISEKIAQDSLNNFMSKKSYFDRLYENVMGDEFPNDMAPSDELDALGIDDSGEGEDEITVTLSRDVAKALCDVLQGAMGEGDLEDGDEGDNNFGGEEAEESSPYAEEDEEGIDTGSTLSTSYDDGKHNKVGDLNPKGGAAHKGANAKLDSGSNLKTAYNDGKSNKVGSLAKGQRAVD